MNQLAKYIILGASIAIVLFLLWYFSSIVVYILISAVLSLIGKPIVGLVDRIRIRGWRPPRALGASLAIVALGGLFLLIFSLMIPLVVNQLNELSHVNTQGIVERFREPLQRLDAFIQLYLPPTAHDFSFQEQVATRLNAVFHVDILTNLFSSTAVMLGNAMVALFSITFITFFFLKDENLFFEGVTLLFPERFERNIKHALTSINQLLRRYFIGIMCQSMGVMLLDTIGLMIVGIPFQTALVIGLFRGVLNVIPYVGPIVGSIIGLLIGLATNLELDLHTQLVPLLLLMTVVFIVVQMIDNMLFQPLIFSSSVKAHPLEIFIVLLMAGSMGGILGMLLAIPGYTVIRVFAKEFFNKFRVVKKLTEKI